MIATLKKYGVIKMNVRDEIVKAYSYGWEQGELAGDFDFGRNVKNKTAKPVRRFYVITSHDGKNKKKLIPDALRNQVTGKQSRNSGSSNGKICQGLRYGKILSCIEKMPCYVNEWALFAYSLSGPHVLSLQDLPEKVMTILDLPKKTRKDKIKRANELVLLAIKDQKQICSNNSSLYSNAQIATLLQIDINNFLNRYLGLYKKILFIVSEIDNELVDQVSKIKMN